MCIGDTDDWDNGCRSSSTTTTKYCRQQLLYGRWFA